MSEIDGTTNYHNGLNQRHIVRILSTYKMRNRICVSDVRNDGIKCVTEKCVPGNCVTAGESFVLELLSSRTILATARPYCSRWRPSAILDLWCKFWDDSTRI